LLDAGPRAWNSFLDFVDIRNITEAVFVYLSKRFRLLDASVFNALKHSTACGAIQIVVDIANPLSMRFSQ